MREHLSQELNSNLLWFMTKKISIENNSIMNGNIERINALRNLALQLLRVFIILLVINILVICLLVILFIINLLYKIDDNLCKYLLVSIVHLFVIYILVYLSNIKIPLLADWLSRTILLSYYAISKSDGEKKIILLK